MFFDYIETTGSGFRSIHMYERVGGREGGREEERDREIER